MMLVFFVVIRPPARALGWLSDLDTVRIRTPGMTGVDAADWPATQFTCVFDLRPPVL